MTLHDRMEWREFVNRMLGKGVQEEWHGTYFQTQDLGVNCCSGGAGNSCMSDSLNCVGTKTIGDDSCFESVYPMIWVGLVSGTLLPSGWGHICCTGEMCYEFAVQSRYLNLGSGNFNFMA